MYLHDEFAGVHGRAEYAGNGNASSRLIKSNAVPCMGALMAARSAPVRMA